MRLFPHCPLCGGQEFLDFNGRPKARCANCNSLERGRLVYSILQRRGRLVPGLSVLHFAPEPGLGRRIRDMAARYVTADFDPGRYAKLFPDTEKVDLCNDSLERHFGQFDLILHNHVLEHLPCDVGEVIRRMLKCLKPGGEMYFTVPTRSNIMTTEDFDPNLSPEERKIRFGQGDHMRIFGDQDVEKIMRSAAAVDVLHPQDLFTPRELGMLAIPRTNGIRGAVYVGRPG